MRFIIHQSGSSPLDEVPEILWEGVREKVNVKDGIYSVRLGEFPDLPITKEIFVISNLELTIEIVRFGTNDSPSYLSGISIDSNPYSVSSVSKKGEDEKQGTLTIVPDTTPRKDEIGLLELRDPNKESLTHELKIEGEGTGLVISFPNEMRLVDHSGTDSGLPDPVKGDDLAPDGTAMDIAVYIKNGAVILGEGLDILPLKLLDGENQEFPLDENGSAYIDSVNASVGQEMRVNKLEVGGPVVGKGTAGVILGKKLEYCKGPPNCPDDPNFKDYGIDPFPAEGESHLTQINSLEIGVKSGQAGELLLEGPEGSTNTANIEVTGKNSYIFAPEIRSPYKVKGQKGLEANPYVIAPAETTVLHSLILATDTLENRDPQYPAHRESVTTRDALKSRLNADAAFDLVSTIPVCSNQAALGPFSENCSETWCMALRADYCDTSEGNGDKDPYADIDPCHGIPGNRLKGYKLNCTSDIFSDHPNLETDPNSPSDGKKFFATNHIHSLLKNADAATLIDIINASTSDQFIKKQLLPTDTVNLDFANTLTGINIFEEVHAAHRVIASMENKIDAFLGTHILKASQPAEIGSLNPQVGQIDFIREGSGESFLNLHSGDAQFKASNLEGRVQRHSVKEDLIIQREAVIYQSPTQVGGQLEFQDSDSDASNGPFFYIPGETIVSGDIRFTTGAQATNRNILGISEISASLYGDNDAAGFFLDPSSSSILSDLEVTGSLKVSGPVTLAQGLYLDQGFFARNYLLADGVLEAKIYADLDNPAFKVEADQVSSLQGLSVQEDLIVSGDLSINSSLTLTGSLQISGNLSSVGDLYIQSPGSSLQAKSLLALNNPTYQLDPSGSSLMRTLQLIPPSNSDGGNLTVGKKMTLSGGITHGGDARISGPINSDEEISTRSIIDFEDPSYVIDPDKDSRLHELTLTNSLEVSQSLSVSDGLTIGADVVANASLEGKTTLDIGQSLIFESGLELRNTTGPVFTVDNTGHILGRAITLENNAFAQDLEIGGGLQLSGPTIEFNANVAMNELKISTHSLIALRSLNPGEVETAARFDANGNLYVHEDMNFQEELSFSSTVTLSSNLSGNEIILSENSGLVSTAVIGDLGSKSLVISGLSAQRLKSTSLEFSLFVDRDDSSFQIDPSSSSLIQDLQISSSLETENTLSSPYLLDLQNQIVVDPSAESELESLEVLSPVTAQMIQLSQLTILSSSQPVGTTLIDAGSFKITREEQIQF